uniref:Uncharacterized protein n=1 Tax=Panagrolaimus sp. JU765 TaxID=591449 RepID=A0AC34Q158_9BILA
MAEFIEKPHPSDKKKKTKADDKCGFMEIPPHLQPTSSAKKIQEEKEPEDRLESFWDRIAVMRTCYFATSLWCIVWNFLGHRKKTFKCAAYLLLFCAIYILLAILILRDLFQPLIANFPKMPEISIKKSPETIVNLGNGFLMIFTVYCNCTCIKVIGEQIGNEIDLLKKQMVEIKSQKAGILPSQMKQQNSGLFLQSANSALNTDMA